ncbi:MAG TPA: glycoside hydrolase family 2 protein [Vicinamibacteria bacterium]|nr:glycoside hydrolase family 2 protein [Vicinamibacteria bacterium]
MHPARRAAVVLAVSSTALLAGAASGADLRLELREGWTIQSSAKVTPGGEVVARPGFATTGWHRATVPTTVVAALVADGTYPDPHYGTNLRTFPGVSYKVGTNFSNVAMPADSPYAVPWWYRTEFTLPAEAAGRRLWLQLGGVNFRFDAWLNGKKIADAAKTAGAFRVHELDVTAVAQAGANALAVLVSAPTPGDLAITFVDWNPMPPDKLMGIYRPVTLTASGPVALRHPQVVTTLAPGYDRAELTVKVFATNASAARVTGTLRGRAAGVAFQTDVALAAGESREIVLAPPAFPQLALTNPKLWWPAQYGEPVLHELELELVTGGLVSDRSAAKFGIREFSSELLPSGRVYTVNGRRILIRGAGWTSEMMLRYSPERFEQEIAYVKDMGLNTIRLEGKLEDDPFFDITDREGILVMPGWCCCDHWEKWKDWDAEDLPVATASLRDQILRLRARASVFTWLNGSDGPPPRNVEEAYLAVLKELGFPNPVVSSATEKKAELSGESGMKMRGPYEWVPPLYWYTDTKLGGPHGFATEIGPGPAPPPLESLKRFIPEDQLWPIGEAWNYHCGGGPFKTLDVFTKAMDARYGPSKDVAEYARKAQAAAYESHRAMLESFAERKYTATGVVQWMQNNAWPGLIWHLYDYYLRPGGSYFGAKKAGEPLHVQYAYDDRSVVVVNAGLVAHTALKATARVIDLESKQHFARNEAVDVGPDGSVKVFQIPELPALTPTWFVALSLDDASGRSVSRNVYWLSTKPDVLAWDKSEWYYTPVTQYADLTGLQGLAPAQVKASVSFDDGRARVELENPSQALAFFVHLAVRKGAAGEEVLPVLWDDNYVTLLPGEKREIAARYAPKDLGGARPVVTLDGWNVGSQVLN